MVTYANNSHLHSNDQRLPGLDIKWLELTYHTVGDSLFLLAIEPGEVYRFVSVNEAFLKVTGATADQVIGKRIEDALPEQAYSLALGKYREALTENRAVRWDEVSQYPAGTRIGEVKVTPLKDEATGQMYLVGSIHDVTDRKLAEDALRVSEAELRALFAAMSDVIFVIDRAGRHLKVAPTNPDILYRPPDSIVGKLLHEIFPEPTARRFLEHVHRALATRSRVNIDYWLDIRGRETWFSATIAPMTDDTVVWVARDISEYKQAARALRESENLYRDTVENANDIIYTLNLDGRYISVNPAGERLTGYTRDEIRQMTFADIIAPEYLETVLRRMAEKVEAGGETTYEVELLTKDRSRVAVEINSRLLEKEGMPVAVLGIARDITERRRSEKALRASEVRFRRNFELGLVGMMISSPTKAWIEVNDELCHILGYERSELLQTSWEDVIHPGDLAANVANFERAMAGEIDGYTMDLRFIHKGGHVIDTTISVKCVRREDDTVDYFLGLIQDVTERRRAEEKLRETEEQLRQSQKLESIGLLAGGIAHDFNNMLTVIKGYSDLILRELSADDPLHTKVDEIRKAGARAATLTHQLLAFSRKQILQTKPLNLNEIVSDVSKMLERLIGEDIDLRVILNERIGQVETDRGQITQVLMNLAVNSRDAMPLGGKLTIETDNVDLDDTYATSHVAVAPGAYVMLAVSDNGIGMDPAIRERIFEPFFTTKPVGVGTGMGLSTVYGVVKQSGGNIWVYSEVGKGTTFKIYLPRIDKVEDIKEEIRTSAVPTGNETILLVEDEELVRDLVRQILETFGYTVLEAANGTDAIKIYEGGCNIDLLVTDVVMPEMGGRDLVKKLSQTHPGLRVIYMSGYTDQAIVHHDILNEGTNFIQKPFNPELLARKVREVLDAS